MAHIDEEGAEEVAEEFGGSGLAMRMDVTEEAAAVSAYRKAVLTYGGVDVLVSNAWRRPPCISLPSGVYPGARATS